MIQGSIARLSQVLRTQPQQILGEVQFSALSTDTRHLQPGAVFIALRGERFDGHQFIPQAFERGAVAVIADRPISGPHLQVPDTLIAYQQIAHWWRQQFQVPVIAITGSAGKTTTKEMLAKALSRYGTVLKSPANHNNDIGLAQTLLQIRAEHQFVVLELAMRGPGEIGRLAGTASPTHALILNIGSAHIGRLGSHEAIAQAKCELLAAAPDLAILNGEDELLLQTAQAYRGQDQAFLTFGLESGDLRGHWDAETQQIHLGDQILPVPLPGRHQALNWMAVLATIHSLGLPLDPLRSPLDLQAELTGRHHRHTLPQDLQILDETYNAAPEALIAALQMLSQIPGRRRWAILGPMRELGDFAPALYAQVGEATAALPLDHLWVLDPDQEMLPLLQALPAQRVRSFLSPEQLLASLLPELQPGDRLLFKAARAIQLETLMQQLIQQWCSRHGSDSSLATSHTDPG